MNSLHGFRVDTIVIMKNGFLDIWRFKRHFLYITTDKIVNSELEPMYNVCYVTVFWMSLCLFFYVFCVCACVLVRSVYVTFTTNFDDLLKRCLVILLAKLNVYCIFIYLVMFYIEFQLLITLHLFKITVFQIFL